MRDKILMGIVAPPIIAFLLALLIALTFFRAWVLHMIWGWYAVPIFSAQAVPTIAFFGALIALMLLRAEKPKSDKSFWRLIWDHVAISGFALGFAYVGSFFV
jgi:hypothetical protein